VLLACAGRADAFRIYAVDSSNNLLSFDSATPGTVQAPILITGLQPGENILGIDFRPATGQLYALGSASRLYIINPTSGAATAVGAAGGFTLGSGICGFDINPVTDRVRVLSNSDQNISLNPNDGTLASTDGELAYAPGDPNNAADPNITAAAHFNPVLNASNPTLYVIDATLDRLGIIADPANGRITSLGSTNVNSSFPIGFDIALVSGSNRAYATMRVGATTGFYSIALSGPSGAGEATLIGPVGGNPNLVGMTVSLAPQTFVVTETTDPGNGVCDANCNLREAINAANAKPGADIISFNIPGSGVKTFLPTNVLPALTDPVTIDGYTQPGASPNTLAVGNNAVLLIQLDGESAGDISAGLVLQGSNCTVRGLVINRCPNVGILLEGSGTGNRIIGNFIGTDASGAVALANERGLTIIASGNTIGGTTPAERNLISGNMRDGIQVKNFPHSSTNNVIQGNYIGTSKNGNAALSNGESGIQFEGSSGNVIGGTAPGAGNVISGNVSAGVLLNGENNLIQANLIGTNASGNASLGNQNGGVYFNCASNNTIGGAAPGARNVISGNTGPDIINGNNVVVFCGTNNRVLGNYIGTDAAGQADLGNPFSGVYIGGDGNFVGGSAPGEGNLISGNNIGVEIGQIGASDNRVEGNRIGVTADGAPLANGTGIFLAGSSDSTIGGPAGAANIIAFNAGHGVAVQTGEGNDVSGNFIFSNGGLGIDLKGGSENASFVTANDSLDQDPGSNRLQNYPTLTAITGSGSTRNVEGELQSAASLTYVIDFYRNDAVDPSGFGEGQTPLGSMNVQTNAQGHATFSFPLDNNASGQYITATATDPAGNTSEFSMASGIVPGPPAPTPTPTPTPPPGLVANVSTRLPVGTDDNVLIEGFIVLGPNGSTKKIMVRALGPFLTQFGIPDALPNPTLEIRDGTNTIVATNNDWRNTQVGGIITGDQAAEIEGSGLAPTNDLESTIIANLAPGNYTAVVRGVNNTVGTGIVDAYDMSPASPARLANVATRGLIQPGDQLMIAGFITQQGDVQAVIRAIGPSLSAFGISNALPDTTLQLRDVNGAIVRENDDWQSHQKQELEDTGLQPGDTREAAMVATLPPGQYTAQVRGKPETTGIGVVEIYFLQ
jgi:CSLREA domain-containing protein